MKKAQFTTRDISYISLCSVLFIICSWLCIPTPVPFTMQNFGMVFACLTFGRRRAFYAVLVYLLAGIAGLPVFAGFRSGLAAVTSPTGGYIIGMLFFPIIIGRKSGNQHRSVFADLCHCAVAMFVLYLFGTLWYTLFFAQNASSILPVLSVCVFPFLIPDAIKCILAVILAKKFSSRVFSH